MMIAAYIYMAIVISFLVISTIYYTPDFWYNVTPKWLLGMMYRPRGHVKYFPLLGLRPKNLRQTHALLDPKDVESLSKVKCWYDGEFVFIEENGALIHKIPVYFKDEKNFSLWLLSN